MRRHLAADSGIALVAALLTVMLLTALGAALVLVTMSETATAAAFARTSEAAYAADALATHAVGDLESAQDWNSVLAGASRGTFVDGPPSGTRPLADGTTISLEEIVNIANCDKTTTCSIAEMDAVTAERPWGSNNPRWQPYSFGPLSALGTETATSSFYVVVLVGDDGSENDDNPAGDGGAPTRGEVANPGAGVVMLRAEAFGPGGAHARVDLTLQRSVRVLSWREVP